MAINPRLEKISRRGKINIWLVDGSLVRKHLDPDFTNFGQHYRFSFIPELEFWLDKEAAPNERSFFIDHLLVEWRLMRDGLDYLKALDLAEARELKERKKSKIIKKLEKINKYELIVKIHARLFKNTENGLSVWIVSGSLVRSLLDIDFTEGGHHLVYNYVPRKEIWLDDDVTEKEQLFIVLHEMQERKLMAGGLAYDPAHDRASHLEWQARHDPELLEKSLAKLGY